MQKLTLLFLAVFSLAVGAGELKYLGRLTSTGTSVNNATTAAPFQVPPNSKLTVYCDVAARILHENESTENSGATTGVPLPATTLFSTSSGVTKVRISGQASSYIAMISVSGTANCDVWLRSGTE